MPKLGARFYGLKNEASFSLDDWNIKVLIQRIWFRVLYLGHTILSPSQLKLVQSKLLKLIYYEFKESEKCFYSNIILTVKINISFKRFFLLQLESRDKLELTTVSLIWYFSPFSATDIEIHLTII